MDLVQLLAQAEEEEKRSPAGSDMSLLSRFAERVRRAERERIAALWQGQAITIGRSAHDVGQAIRGNFSPSALLEKNIAA